MSKENTSILVTGGAGFIGSHFVDYAISKGHHVIVVDALTYAGNKSNLMQAEKSGQLTFIHGNVCDTELLLNVYDTHKPQMVFHLAAESHVDNAIKNPQPFVDTNVTGTLSMLSAAHSYYETMHNKDGFRFVHVSTDEVFGDLAEDDKPFDECSSYAPNSAYAASKAAADHFVRAWQKTYDLPTIVTHCSNNFGPRQHAEKLIPVIISKALNDQSIPLYGDGRNIRDWIFVHDFCEGLYLAGIKGQVGQHYCFGAQNERRNIDIAHKICSVLDERLPRQDGCKYSDQIAYVMDRKGHDWRYAINSTKASDDLGWRAQTEWETALMETVEFYVEQRDGA